MFIHAFGATAWAQQSVHLPGEDKGIIQWLVAVGIAILVCVSAFLNPKRSHRV